MTGSANSVDRRTGDLRVAVFQVVIHLRSVLDSVGADLPRDAMVAARELLDGLQAVRRDVATLRRLTR